MLETYLALRHDFSRKGEPAAKANASTASIYNARRERRRTDTVTRKRY